MAAYAGLKRILVLAAVLVVPAAVRGADGDRPLIASEIERGLDGFFIFTTSGNGEYAIYQLLSGPRGMSDDSDVVCMSEQCYAPLAVVPQAALEQVAVVKGHREAVRQAFRSAQRAYRELQRAGPAEVEPRTSEWRGALSVIGACIRDPERCGGRR
ncbi:hypothetical protein [Terrihabitans rhizophilus]|uniref:Uncharacterized protein n=1 Tax=Terrihabitans rhizophilus TaxID=3092662 RepID=A0ABU4RL45_9HYPH|nr:hypothetical protein [Terrihabitans sp. PJ23]MDX6805527.1 hypothetical protein [Terrihabitans sp. PJ23]